MAPRQRRKMVQQVMRHWQHDSDLAGIRDRDALAQLPADERERASASGPMSQNC